jgi:hypothetical protein
MTTPDALARGFVRCLLDGEIRDFEESLFLEFIVIPVEFRGVCETLAFNPHHPIPVNGKSNPKTQPN